VSRPDTGTGAPGTDVAGADAPAPRPGTLAARRAAARERTSPDRPVSRRPRPAAGRAGDGAAEDGPRAETVRVGAPLDGARDESTEFLLQSLRDLEREHDAGDLDDDDYEALKDDYTVRAAAALRAEQRGKAPPPPVKQRRPVRQWAVIVACVVGFAVLAGVLVAQASGERSAGEGVTGEVVDSPTQAAGRCINLSGEVQQGTAGAQEALECYQDVLADDPDNPVARTYLGWTLYLTARQAAGSLTEDQLAELYVEAHRQLDLAVAADARYADARAFQIALAVNEERYADAAEHLAVFDDLDVPADMAALVDPLRQEISDGLAAESGDGSTTDETTSTTAPG
jgi:tetratricopeptide (TPR) repeat protein